MRIPGCTAPESDEEFSHGGIVNKPDAMPGPPHWLYYIRVANVDEAVERVDENGGKVLNGPMAVPGGDMIAMCIDP